MSVLFHNEITLNQLESFVSKGEDCCVVNPCGSGKTSVMTAFLKNHADKKAVILTKQANAKAYYEEKDPCFLDTTIKTYSMMLSDYRNNRMDDYNADYLIVDEAHYIGANKWNEAFTYIRNLFHPIVIGFTATPQRFEDQGTDETIVTEYFNGNSAGNFSTKQLQKQGIFREPEYILSLYNLESEIEDRLEKIEESDLPEEKVNDLKNRLYNIFTDWKKMSCPEIVLREALPRYMYKQESNRILIYMPSVADIDKRKDEIDTMIRKIFPEKEIISYRYTYKDSEEELRDFLKEDKTYVKILYSVDKIMETIHIDDLNILIMLRASVSNRIITQQFGRINSIGNDKKPLVIDMVGNLNKINSVNFLHAGSTERKASGTQKPNFNLTYATKYADLFTAIDGIFSRATSYTYGGITETLHNLCEIFNKNYDEVRDLVRDKKIDIDRAFDAARPSRRVTVTSDLLNGTYTFPDFTLTDSQKKLVSENMDVVDRFIERKKIEDEDVIQNLYMGFMYIVSNINNENDYHGYLSHHLLTRLKTLYVKLLRMKMTTQQLYETEDIGNMPLCDQSDLVETIAFSETEKYVHEALQTLTEREQKVLNMRFFKNMTLEEAGKEIGVTRNRIRQIEIKAIRKLRHPSKKLYTLLY